MSRRNSRQRLLLGALGLVLGIGSWEVFAAVGSIDIRIFSSPSRVVLGIVSLFLSADFYHDLALSGSEFGLGMVAALLLGIPLGLILGWYKDLGLTFDPLLMAIYSLPRTALMPIIMVALGIGITSKAVIIFLGAVFPIMVNTMAGLRRTEPSLVRAARSFGATEMEIFRLILLPSTLPYLMAGVRLGLGRAVIGVITAEMYVATGGLGHKIMLYQTGLNTDALMAVAFVTATFGFTLITLARRLERSVSHWRVQTGEGN